MEDKDQIDENEELNQENQGNIDDADDSFGLPDFDIKPLDEIEDEAKTPEKAPEFIEPEKEADTDVHKTKGEIIYSKPTEETKEETSYSDNYSSVEGSKSYLQEEEKSNVLKISLIVISVLLLLSASGWYLFMYAPEQKRLAKEEADKLELQEEQQRIAAEEENRRKEALAAAEAANLAASAVDEVESAGVTRLSDRTGLYHVVINSFIDEDLAMDQGKALAEKGINSSLIPPFSKTKMYRLVLGDYQSFQEAQSSANDMKGDYGQDIWVLKF